MANTSKKKKTEPVTNCDQLENETDITPVEEIDITCIFHNSCTSSTCLRV